MMLRYWLVILHLILQLKINPHDDETWEALEWNTSKSIPEGTPNIRTWIKFQLIH